MIDRFLGGEADLYRMTGDRVLISSHLLSHRIPPSLLRHQSGPLKAAVIDKPNNMGYFATYTNPSKIVKVDLGTGSNLPTRVNALTLNTNESYVSSGTLRRAGARQLVHRALPPQALS